jgi:hypothetical protein
MILMALVMSNISLPRMRAGLVHSDRRLGILASPQEHAGPYISARRAIGQTGSPRCVTATIRNGGARFPDRCLRFKRAISEEPARDLIVDPAKQLTQEAAMGFGKGMLLWLIGIPIPIILLVALFMHH